MRFCSGRPTVNVRTAGPTVTATNDVSVGTSSGTLVAEQVVVATGPYQVPLRPPVDLAQQFLTMRALLGNRISLGVGPGSTAAGYAAVSMDFENRFKTFHANMDTIRRLMAGETVGPANLAPWPSIVGGPRFLLGAWHGGASLARAARDYDGWLCSAGRTTVATIVEGTRIP